MEFFNSLYWDIGNMLKTPSHRNIYYLKTNNIICHPTVFFDPNPNLKSLMDNQDLMIPLPKHLWDAPIKKSPDDVIQIAGPDYYQPRMINKCVIDVPDPKNSYIIKFKGDTFGDLISSIHNFLLSKNVRTKKIDKFYLNHLFTTFDINVRENKIMYGLKKTPDDIFNIMRTGLQNKFDKNNLLMYQLLLPPYHRIRGCNKLFYQSGVWITTLVCEY
jgi:hypothetical protein